METMSQHTSPNAWAFDMPCGCRMTGDTINGKRVLMFEPHALDCPNYLYALKEAEQQGKPVTTIDAR